MNFHYPHITLKPGREASLLRGHPWIFSGAIATVEGSPNPGDCVTAKSSKGKPLGVGFYNAKSDIAFRLLTTDPSAEIDAEFWRKRIAHAIALRERIIPPQTDAYRLINAEGDGMPGLVVDRYGSCLVISIATAGIEKWRTTIIESLMDAVKPSTIYERSEGRARQLEGLEDRTGLAAGSDLPEKVLINEHGLHFEVDILAGQKTGFFLDQRCNRQIVGSLARDASVLNCFSYTGGFSIYCAHGGAKRVVSVETSASANAIAARNLENNGFSAEQHQIVTDDVFAYLRKTSEEFDLIIVDPPAFAKSRKDVERAARAYKDVNLQAIKRLKPGGLLATFSCSNHLDESLFHKIVLAAVRDAGAGAQVLMHLAAGADHPVNLAHPEGRYLKGLLLRVLKGN